MNGVMGEERVISGHKQASGMSACSASGSGYVLHRQFSLKNVTDCLFSYCEASLHPDFEGFWREKKLSYLLLRVQHCGWLCITQSLTLMRTSG